MLRRITITLALLAVAVAWCVWPTDPDAWRTFTREAEGAELRELTNDYDRAQYERWQHYLHALQAGDEEALEVAHRLCPLIVSSAHPSEEFLGALGWRLEQRPAEVFELLKPCFPGVHVCMDFEHETDAATLKASNRRRHAAVSELLDGGYAELAAACLEELSN